MAARNIIITGATGDIGHAIVDYFVHQGANIYATSTSEEKFDSLIAKYSIDQLTSWGSKITGGVHNLSNRAESNSLVDEAVDVLGGCDVLVCNAGVNSDRLLIRMTDDDWDKVIEVNLSSTFVLNRSAVRHMLRKKHGRIINITSVVCHMGNAGQANYCAAKAGINGITKSIATEYASQGITANCVAPGFIDTQMTQKMPERAMEEILSRIPAKRRGSTEEVAYAVGFLASEQAGYITGSTIHVNGGLYMS